MTFMSRSVFVRSVLYALFECFRTCSIIRGTTSEIGGNNVKIQTAEPEFHILLYFCASKCYITGFVFFFFLIHPQLEFVPSF